MRCEDAILSETAAPLLLRDGSGQPLKETDLYAITIFIRRMFHLRHRGVANEAAARYLSLR